jgi:hypothetical protein
VCTYSNASATPVRKALARAAEERLRKLDDLLKKGLITKAEYDKKRADILKEICPSRRMLQTRSEY